MDINELKKVLYKEKPVAQLLSIKKGFINYDAEIEFGAAPVFFRIPIADIGDAEFLPEMPSQSLIRYLVEPNES